MAAKKKLAKKTTRKSSSGGNKADFVRGLPDLTAKEVVAKALEGGIKLSDAYVYKLRSAAKNGSAPKAPRATAAASSNGAPQTATAFVRALPAGTSASEAVAQAKAAGVNLTEGYYYALRSSLGLSGKKGRPKGTTTTTAPVAVKERGKPGPKPKGKPGPKPKSAGGSAGLTLVSNDPTEQAVIDAVHKLGAVRIRAVIEAVERLQQS